MRPDVELTLPWESILRRSLVLGLALAILALFIVAEPHDALTKAHLIGFATCHQLPERTLHVDDHQLPLCARCTGIYIGLLAGWLFLAAKGRARAAQLPPRPILLTLIGFIVVMGIDGVNSTLMRIPGLPHLYHTENWMRVFTGSLYGIAVSMLLTPYVTVTLWREPTGDRTLKTWGELLILFNLVAALDVLALTEAPILLWPLVVVSVAGMLGLMGLMNLSIVTVLAGKVNVYGGWRDLLLPGAVGIALALVEFTVIGAMRIELGLVT